MTKLTHRITAAIDFAIASEGDIRVQEFLRAISILVDANTGSPTSVSITCDNRYWIRHIMPDAARQLEEMSLDELAVVVASWIQGAFDKDMLSISNPPSMRRNHGAPAAILASQPRCGRWIEYEFGSGCGQIVEWAYPNG